MQMESLIDVERNVRVLKVRITQREEKYKGKEMYRYIRFFITIYRDVNLSDFL